MSRNEMKQAMISLQGMADKSLFWKKSYVIYFRFFMIMVFSCRIHGYNLRIVSFENKTVLIGPVWYFAIFFICYIQGIWKTIVCIEERTKQ